MALLLFSRIVVSFQSLEEHHHLGTLIVFVETAVMRRKNKKVIHFNTLSCIKTCKFFEVPIKTNQAIQDGYKIAVGIQDTLSKEFEGRIYTLTADFINSTLFGCFCGMFLLQSKH